MLIKKNSIVKCLLWFLGAIYLVFLISKQAHFLISETGSVGKHYFLHLPNVKPKINDYTVFVSHWYQGKIIKKIIGLENDQIWYNKNCQLVVNNFIVGIPKNIATDGRKLHGLPPQTIPPGFVFLYSEHEKSFDSRYQELGLVPIDQLQGLVIPLV